MGTYNPPPSLDPTFATVTLTGDLTTPGSLIATGGGQTGKFLTGQAGNTVFAFSGDNFDIRAGTGGSASQNVMRVTSAGNISITDLTIGGTTTALTFSNAATIVAGSGLTMPAFTLGGTMDANSQALINVSDLDLGTESAWGTFSAMLTAANAGTAWLIKSKGTSDILRPRLGLSGGVDIAVWGWEYSTHTGIVLSGALNANSQAITNHAQAITDNAILTVDHITPVATDYARFTANGLEGREKSEVLGDLNVADGADVTGSNTPQAHTHNVGGYSGQLADDQHIVDAEAVSAVEAAGLTFAENKGIILDALLSGDGQYSGITEAGTAGAILAFGDIVYLAVADTKWELAKADVAATSKGKIGMVVLAASEDAATVILLYGKIRAATLPTLTVGAPVHISAATAGDVAVAAPTGTTNFVVRIIGYGNTAEDLFFCPDNTYVELA